MVKVCSLNIFVYLAAHKDDDNSRKRVDIHEFDDENLICSLFNTELHFI